MGDGALELLRAVKGVLDEHERRLREVEQIAAAVEQRVAPWTFAMPGVTRRRRQTVARLREAGFSMQLIADTLGVALATVQRDLEQTPHRAPPRARGADGKAYPTHRNGDRPGA
jgi:DNA invertase Pin-like site-specific DNA recombinase